MVDRDAGLVLIDHGGEERFWRLWIPCVHLFACRRRHADDVLDADALHDGLGSVEVLGEIRGRTSTWVVRWNGCADVRLKCVLYVTYVIEVPGPGCYHVVVNDHTSCSPGSGGREVHGIPPWGRASRRLTGHDRCDNAPKL